MQHGFSRQRGFALIVALAVVTMLSLLGFLVLDAVVNDMGMVTSARQTNSALYVAEAGLGWAIDKVSLAYDGLSAFGDLTQSTLYLSNVIVAGDPACPTTSCSVLVSPPGWRRITPPNAVPYGSGEFQVFIRDDDDGDNNSDVDTNGIILIRTLGRSGRNSGAYRVVEVAIQLAQ